MNAISEYYNYFNITAIEICEKYLFEIIRSSFSKRIITFTFQCMHCIKGN